MALPVDKSEPVTVSTSQARDDMSELLHRIRYAGAEITITSYGRPMAVMVNPDELARLKALAAKSAEK